MAETRPSGAFGILVVEDEEDLRELIIADLRRRPGCEVHGAANTLEAWMALQAHSIDLVLSDMRMPNGGGLALVSRIREELRPPPLVILMTGFSDFSEEQCVAHGAMMVLNKPFPRKVLLAAVDQAEALRKR